MEAAIEEQARIQRQMQESSGAEKDELKKRTEALEESVRRAQADRNQIQTQWEAQMQDKEMRLRSLMQTSENPVEKAKG